MSLNLIRLLFWNLVLSTLNLDLDLRGGMSLNLFRILFSNLVVST
jgi:hypothetical protein